MQKQDNTPKTAEEYREAAARHKAALKQQWRIFLKTGLFAVAAAIVLVLSSVAWFVNSEKATAAGEFTSAKPAPSVYIQAGDLKAEYGSSYKAHYTAGDYVAEAQLSGNLYPISTPNLQDWYYAAAWRNIFVHSYGRAELTRCTDEGQTDRFNYTADDKTFTAYNMAEYTVYTGEGDSMDVYFHPENGLLLTENEDSKRLMQALRVGFEVDGELLFVYAPYGEHGRGNSSATMQSDTYYCVNGLTSSDLLEVRDGSPYLLLNSLESYTALSEDGKFAAGDTKLFTADGNGQVLRIYVWLEGTDAQAMIGDSNNATGIHLSFSLVGVEQEP